MIKTVAMPVAWGGSRDDETFLDVLCDIQKLAPSAKFRILEGYPNHSGGWPIIEITADESELALLEEL